MKEMIIITISIFAVLVAANVHPEGAKLEWGSVKAAGVTETTQVQKNAPATVELTSAKGDWNASPAPQGAKTVFKNSVRLVNFNDAGGDDALRTAELR